MTAEKAEKSDSAVTDAVVEFVHERWPAVRSVCDASLTNNDFLSAFGARGVSDCVRAGTDPKGLGEGRRFDLVLSLGAAEKLSADLADGFVAGLCDMADRIIFSSASPGLGGGAVNEQWSSYWVEKFAGRGLSADDSLRRAIWSDRRIDLGLRQSILVFERKAGGALSPASFDMVHPDVLASQREVVAALVQQNNQLREKVWAMQPADGASRHWARIVMNKETSRLIGELDYKNFHALEISGNAWANFGFKDFTFAVYPEFDVCKQIARRADNGGFDIVIAEQVLEHVPMPWQAVTGMRASLNDGGYLLITTPFMIRVHAHPGDYTRWTEEGLKKLLEFAGFAEENIVTGSWGNRWCVVANFDLWQQYDPLAHSLANEPDVPIHVWALAKK